MTVKDFEFIKRNLNGCIVEYEVEEGIYINTISVLTQEGKYKIIKDYANDTYLVEYIPNSGRKVHSRYFTMSGVIEYIKEGDKYKE